LKELDGTIELENQTQGAGKKTRRRSEQKDRRQKKDGANGNNKEAVFISFIIVKKNL